MTDTAVALNSYRLLGRSGLRVSPLALGTMTFGSEWGWGADKDEARRLFDLYVDRGGNFFDTAVNYTNGSSERLLGEFVKGKRDRFVIATKFTFMTTPGDPNSGGNHRLNMIRSLETSLKQLGTDRIDLFYMHRWDFTTNADEIMRGLDDLVRSGKVVYVGVSNTPAWRVAQMQTLADLRGWSPFIALQIEYSLIERTVEFELIPMAREMGLGVVPWSPLGSGLLSGKYSRADLQQGSNGGSDVTGSRKGVMAAFGRLNERTLSIADTVRDIAAEIGATPSQVALAWLLQKPGVASTLIGARTAEQLEDNLGALNVSLSDDMCRRLDSVSATESIFPNTVLENALTRNLLFGGLNVEERA